MSPGRGGGCIRERSQKREPFAAVWTNPDGYICGKGEKSSVSHWTHLRANCAISSVQPVAIVLLKVPRRPVGACVGERRHSSEEGSPLLAKRVGVGSKGYGEMLACHTTSKVHLPFFVGKTRSS